MKIVLVATDSGGKNLVFVSDILEVYSLSEALRLVHNGELEDVYPVRGSAGLYLRTKPTVPKKEHLDHLSISSYKLFAAPDNLDHALAMPVFDTYWPIYKRALIEAGGPFIAIKEHTVITKKQARDRLIPHKDLIFVAAKKFDVDPYLLGAIIIDEVARFAPFEIMTDPLGGLFLGANTSVGIAQVEIDTAHDLIVRGYYHPNPRDSRLSPKNVQNISRQELYPYVKKHSIAFAAARMRALTDEWKRFVDLSKGPEIIATLYHLERRKPHAHPRPNERGLQITQEFYLLAKDWLR